MAKYYVHNPNISMSFYSAHNGNKFDFPLLMKEIKRAGASLQTEVLCVDTWVGCKHLLTDLRSYSLPNVYKELLGSEPPSSHEAEADCFNLMAVTAMMEQWIPWAEKKVVKFDTIQPM